MLVIWCFSRQNLEQCWTAELRPAAGETEGPPAQGQGGGMFLWRHDRPQHPHGHETPGTGGRVPAHRQVSGATKILNWLQPCVWQTMLLILSCYSAHIPTGLWLMALLCLKLWRERKWKKVFLDKFGYIFLVDHKLNWPITVKHWTVFDRIRHCVYCFAHNSIIE